LANPFFQPPAQTGFEWIPDDDVDPTGGLLFDPRHILPLPVEMHRQDGSILVID
jgi:hypothetical protein